MPESFASYSGNADHVPARLPKRRHASFNSPREVPLPSPTAVYPDNFSPFSFSATAPNQGPSSSKAQDAFETHSSSILPSPSAVYHENDLRSSPTSSRPRSPVSPSQRSFLHADPPRRPPQMHNNEFSGDSSPPSPSIESRLFIARSISDLSHPGTSDPLARISFPDTQSCSLSTAPTVYLRQSPPPPSAIPPDLSHMSTTWLDRSSSASLPLPSQIPFHALPRLNPASNSLMPSPTPTPPSDLGSDVRAPRQPSPPSLSTEVASPHLPDRSAFRCPSVDEATSSSSSSSSGSRDSGATSSSSLNTENSVASSDKLSSDPSLTAVHTGPQNQGRSNARPISPFRAPQPPPPQATRSPAFDFSTAMGRFMPPHTSPSYLPPEPPVILPAEPGDDMTQSISRPHAPHFPFLSHAPPPPDSWIEVETTLHEYKLHVRLPGFSREGITLATKRRRILHVVADRWDNGGGHFERRISFGYDADLVQVRAEFDGTMLRIVVPRRISPVTLHTPGPIGRT